MYLSRRQHPLEPHLPIAPRSDASSTLLVNSPKGAITALPLRLPWFLIGCQYLQAQVLAHAGFLFSYTSFGRCRYTIPGLSDVRTR
jgi:hypothetical protein